MFSKKLHLPLIALAVLALMTSLALAQGPGGRPPGGGGPPTAASELKQLQAKLTLTDEQSEQILPILQKRHTEIDALMSSGSTDRSATMEQMHTIIDATNKEIRVLLTEAQQKIFDTLRPNRPPTNGSTTNSNTDSNSQEGPPPPSN